MKVRRDQAYIVATEKRNIYIYIYDNALAYYQNSI